MPQNEYCAREALRQLMKAQHLLPPCVQQHGKPALARPCINILVLGALKIHFMLNWVQLYTAKTRASGKLFHLCAVIVPMRVWGQITPKPAGIGLAHGQHFRIGLPVLARRPEVRHHPTGDADPVHLGNEIAIMFKPAEEFGHAGVVHVAVHHKFSGQRRAAARGLRQRLSVFHFNPPAFSPAGLPDYVRQLPLSRSQKYKHNSQGKPRFPAKTCPNCYRTTAFPPLPFHRASAKGKTI